MNQIHNDMGRRAAELQDYQDVLAALSSGTYTKQGDIIDWTLWDRFTIDGTTPILRHVLFQNGRGSLVGGVARTLADTSVEGAQAIPQGSKLYVRAIAIFYQAKTALTEATLQDLAEMLQETTMNVHVRGKDTQGQWALDEIAGETISAAISHSAAGSFVVPATQNIGRGVKLLNLPIILAAQTHFEVQVEHHVAPSSDLDDDLVKIGLVGIMERLS